MGLFLKQTNPTAQFYNWDGNEDKAQVDFTTGTWMLLECIHSGGTLFIRSNNGTQQTASSGNTTGMTGNFRIGIGGDSDSFAEALQRLHQALQET
jgi:hypothetical protein